jgi:hypothetical protein
VKSLRSLLVCALALSFVPSLAPSVARADEPSLTDWARSRVGDGLLKPLAKAESSRFSRARPAPRERRVRITQAATSDDKKGKKYVPFAIDVRYGGEWHENDVVGCVYRGTGALFVKRGDAYRPAEFLLGKNVQPVAGVCETAAAPAA